MVNLLLKHFEEQLKAALPFLDRIDIPVYQVNNGQIYKGYGSEKEQVSISDQFGSGLYIRQTQVESMTQGKFYSSCHKEFKIATPCRMVFYCFGEKTFDIVPDDVKSKMLNALRTVHFADYKGNEFNVSIIPNTMGTGLEKIFTEETKKKYDGNEWPILVAIDFTLNYSDFNCEPCLTTDDCL